ncbi:hypothetical protein HYS94_02430 [Candidatus Daviesbacteria bacterium]|nr:hypothetical protein [Candidatus Daviesbacteria bacterium]
MEDQLAQFKSTKITRGRLILIILALIILGEVIWAVLTLKPSSNIPSAVQQQTATSVSLNSEKATVKVGEQINTTINLSSDIKTDGVDLIIKFDPNLLAVSEATAGAGPVKVGSIYSAYPQNLLESPGRIVISGITNQPGGILANGVFGTITFKAKKVGVTDISFEFTPSTTTDSNIIESGTGKDVLEKVNNLQLNITP